MMWIEAMEAEDVSDSRVRVRKNEVEIDEVD